MKEYLKYIIYPIIFIIILFSVYVYSLRSTYSKKTEIGKYFHVNITTEIANDNELLKSKLKLLKSTVIAELIDFLESNDLKIKEGTYKLHQTNDLKTVKSIFDFDKLDP